METCHQNDDFATRKDNENGLVRRPANKRRDNCGCDSNYTISKCWTAGDWFGVHSLNNGGNDLPNQNEELVTQ